MSNLNLTPGSLLDRVPATIRIGTTDYTVTVGFADAKLSQTTRGQIHYESAEITLNAGLPDGRVAEVLLHEAIHGIDCEYGPLRLSEKQVVALAKGVLALLRANGEFVLLMVKEEE